MITDIGTKLKIVNLHIPKFSWFIQENVLRIIKNKINYKYIKL